MNELKSMESEVRFLIKIVIEGQAVYPNNEKTAERIKERVRRLKTDIRNIKTRRTNK